MNGWEIATYIAGGATVICIVLIARQVFRILQLKKKSWRTNPRL